MPTFTWTPDYQANGQRKTSTKGVKFGDGYEQRFGDGINTVKQVWSLTFSARDQSETDDIDDFLIARAGVESFDWTPPRAVSAGKYICREWSRIPQAGVYDTISAVFEQVYES